MRCYIEKASISSVNDFFQRMSKKYYVNMLFDHGAVEVFLEPKPKSEEDIEVIEWI